MSDPELSPDDAAATKPAPEIADAINNAAARADQVKTALEEAAAATAAAAEASASLPDEIAALREALNAIGVDGETAGDL